ncbi:MAG: Gfo/Idh/MocA family oxidoreductase, partial [Planctomycetes bacterium]|nr:Gfo/Idh/MocA family oxidoreductase [Planctomycetota bacterium]
GGKMPERFSDFRHVLDHKDIDAVIVATPDHWHALATILACQAGKDVYVEKPPSHNVWEGRKMVDAARRYERIVQVGTQNRSAPYAIEAREYIKSGALGEIYLCKIFNLRKLNLSLGPGSTNPISPAGCRHSRGNRTASGIRPSERSIEKIFSSKRSSAACSRRQRRAVGTDRGVPSLNEQLTLRYRK